MGGPVSSLQGHQPHRTMGLTARTPLAVHHDTHLAPPRPKQDHNPLQRVRARQSGQTRTPLLPTPPLVPHAGAQNANPHMQKSEPRYCLHTPLHLLLPHVKITRSRTDSCIPPRETNHLESDRGIRHPHHAACGPIGPPHQRPRHIRLSGQEPMPAPTTITSEPHLLHRRLRRVCPHAHHRGSHPATHPRRGTAPHGPPHRLHNL